MCEVVGVAPALSMIPRVEAILRYESNASLAQTADQLGSPFANRKNGFTGRRRPHRRCYGNR
jgi:hypothetical protein